MIFARLFVASTLLPAVVAPVAGQSGGGAAAGVQDPRLEPVELSLAGRHDEALTAVERFLAVEPERARSLGFDFLRAHLLDETGRTADAGRAFAAAMTSDPALAPYARWRLALGQSRMGHPEVAAGLLATLLGGDPPPPLVPRAVELLVEAIDDGGDCRLLAAVDRWRIPDAERRRLQLARADCELRQKRRPEAEALYLRLLADGTEDESARSAAERLDELLDGRPPATRELALTLGAAFHHHRQFGRSTAYLTIGIGDPLSPPPGELASHLERLYALARGHFWRGEYLLAASRFGQLASQAAVPEERARALYQQGRCHELRGDWGLAADSYRRVVAADPDGRWAAPGLFAVMRLAWRAGTEAAGLEAFQALAARREWQGLHSRAALFLAASDLVRGRADRADAWLQTAARHRAVTPTEAGYWRGRLAELEARDADAATAYAAAVRAAPYHPLAAAAAARLRAPRLESAAEALGRRLAGSRLTADLIAAWRLLGDEHSQGAAARATVERRAAANPRARPYLELETPPASEWPLWRASLRQPEERLLALGVWSHGAPAIPKHFPVADVALGFAGSRLLAGAGERRRSLYQAEILARRVPAELPDRLLPPAMRQLLYPLPWRESIAAESRRQGVDSNLLVAILREESRFDPRAVSSASARGLAQFVLSTARELSGRLGIEGLRAADLHDPEISIALGAAYLAELASRFGAGSPAVVAAYNAGPDQARLWQAYCFSREPEEYLSKVGFIETRAYLERVLTSRNHYREIYGEGGWTTPTTSPGGSPGALSK